MPIETTQDKEQNLTIHVVTGQLTEEEVFTTLERFYGGETTALVLWDFSQAEMSSITPAVIQRIIRKSAESGARKQRRKTAAITPSDLLFGLGRMAESYADFEALPFDFRVFRSREMALEWLISKNDT